MADDMDDEAIAALNGRARELTFGKPKDPFLAGGKYWKGYQEGLEAAIEELELTASALDQSGTWPAAFRAAAARIRALKADKPTG